MTSRTKPRNTQAPTGAVTTTEPDLPLALAPAEPGTTLRNIIGTRMYVSDEALLAAGCASPSHARFVHDQVYVTQANTPTLVILPWRHDGHTWLSFATWTAIASLYRARGAPLPAWLS